MKYYLVEVKTTHGIFTHWVKNFQSDDFINEMYPYATDRLNIKVTQITKQEYYKATNEKES